MDESQMDDILGGLVKYQNFLKEMSPEDIRWVIQNPKEAIRIFIGAIRSRDNINLMLEHLGKERIPSLPGKFVVKDNFIVDFDGVSAQSGIGYVCSFFKGAFYGITEEPIIGATDIYRYVLCMRSDAKDITNKFSDSNDFTVKFSEIFYLIKQQFDGVDGILSTRKANTFYVTDLQGKIHQVYVSWDLLSHVWGVHLSVGYKTDYAGEYIFSSANIPCFGVCS